MTETMRAAVAFAIVTSAAACKHDREIVADPPTRAVTHAKGVHVEIVEVADDVDLLAGDDESALPKGARRMTELPPVGADEHGAARYQPSHFARVVVQPDESRAAAFARVRAWLDPIATKAGVRVAIGAWIDPADASAERDHAALRTYAVRGAPFVTEADITGAELTIGKEDRMTYVSITFDDAGRRRLADATERLVWRRTAIIIDGEVESVPVVQTKIASGRLQIVLGERQTEALANDAKHLVARLRGA